MVSHITTGGRVAKRYAAAFRRAAPRHNFGGVPPLFINAETIRRLLPMADCIDAVADGLRATTRGEVILPLRQVVLLPEGRGALASMPVIAPAWGMAVKVITVLPGNHGTAFASHQGSVLLFGHEHGDLEAVLDATEITAIRTAAASGVATRLLARDDAATLAILGSGMQAHTHIEAMRAVRPIRHVKVWSPSREHREAFAVSERREDLQVEACDTAEAAVRNADVVCTVTAATEPVLRGAWLGPGVHVNAVGASVATARELDTDAVRGALLFVDRRESAEHEAGDYLIPAAEGVISSSHIVAELGDVLENRSPGRRGPTEVTVFKSLGLAIEDLVAARLVYQRTVSGR